MLIGCGLVVLLLLVVLSLLYEVVFVINKEYSQLVLVTFRSNLLLMTFQSALLRYMVIPVNVTSVTCLTIHRPFYMVYTSVHGVVLITYVVGITKF